jgi:hypothetical protein
VQHTRSRLTPGWRTGRCRPQARLSPAPPPPGPQPLAAARAQQASAARSRESGGAIGSVKVDGMAGLLKVHSSQGTGGADRDQAVGPSGMSSHRPKAPGPSSSSSFARAVIPPSVSVTHSCPATRRRGVTSSAAIARVYHNRPGHHQGNALPAGPLTLPRGHRPLRPSPSVARPGTPAIARIP